MSYKLYLDDMRNPTQSYKTSKNSDWVIVRSYQQFVDTITKCGMPFLISFDHDLADEHYPFNEPDGGIRNPKIIPYDTYREKTGFHCAKWLVEYCMDKNMTLPAYNVHSANVIGSANITSYLESFRKSYQPNV